MGLITARNRARDAGVMRRTIRVVRQMQGSMSQIKVDDPSAFERAQYMRALTTYRPAAEQARRFGRF
jgi:hypothetical protein